MKIKKIIICILIIVVALLAGAFTFRYYYLESLVYSKVNLQAGAKIPGVDAFVKKNPFKSYIKTDLTKLDTTQLVEIPVEVVVCQVTMDTKLSIYDDKSPELRLKEVTIGPKEKVTIDDFVEEVSDATVVSLEYDGKYDFSKAKDVEVTIVARDAADNTTKETTMLHVIEDTTPPVISGVEDIVVKRGATISYKKNIKVTDDYDENPTLEIDFEKVNTKVLGDYEISYTATDQAGNSSTETCTVTVESSELDNVTAAMVNAKADEILAQIISDEMTDEQKVKACFDWCYNNITYVETAYEPNWVKAAYKGMVERRGDCTANWGSMKCMLNRLGIQNMDIVKTYNGKWAHHSWNLVNLGDGWYHVDSMKNMWNVPIFMWTTDQLMAHSNAHNNTHGFDKSKYPKIQ